MELTDIPVHAADVVSHLLDGEAVLVHPQQDMVRVLHAVGARLWELADGRHSVDDLVAAIVVEYDVDPARAQADVLAFCEDLLGRGVLALADSTPARWGH